MKHGRALHHATIVVSIYSDADDDFSLWETTAHVIDSKFHESHTVALSDVVKDALDEWLEDEFSE